MDEASSTPGLKYRRRAGGRVPYWFPPEGATDYPVRSANLSTFASDPALLAARCQRLQAEYLSWKHNRELSAGPVPAYDGTFGRLIEIYLSDPESTYQALKLSSVRSYKCYARKLKAHIGAVSIAETDGRQVKRWFALWAGQDPANPKSFTRLAAGRTALAVLKAAVTFGVVCRVEDCFKFQMILRELEFPALKPRDHAPTAAQVGAAMQAAHDAGAHSRAFAYALQFETTLRQWDVIGTWVPLSDPRPSSVLDRGDKWIGPTWANIDENLTLRFTHGKTEDNTGARGVYDLTECPLVMAELERVPIDKRVGPLVPNEKTGRPYRYETFRTAWGRDRKAAGIPSAVWNRDLRAGGNTEASMGGVHVEDRAKVSGHSKKTNAKVYDRDHVEAHRRSMQARIKHRNGTKT